MYSTDSLSYPECAPRSLALRVTRVRASILSTPIKFAIAKNTAKGTLDMLARHLPVRIVMSRRDVR